MSCVILLVIITFTIPSSFYAQQTPQANSRQTRAASNQVLHRVPFEFYGGHIYFRVRVNGSEPHWFLLDSGAPDAYISTELAQAVGLRLQGSLGITGTGTGRIRAAYVRDVTYNISGAEFTDGRSVAAPSQEFFHPLENSFGRSFHGILGYDFLNSFVVEIDYANQIINLYDPANYRYTGSGEIIPIRLNDKKPYVNATLTPLEGSPIPSNIHLDIGYGGTLSLNGKFVAANNLIQSAGTTIETFRRGAGGETAARIGRVRSLQLGRFTIANPTASFSLVQGRGVRSDSSGSVGGQFLQRFKVTLDYSRKQMILEPNANFSEPFEADMSGISLVAERPDFRIVTVYRLVRNSPATEAGVREGDIILSVDGTPAPELTLERIRQMFRREGQERLLSVRRGEDMLQIRIRLRRLI